MVWQKMGGALCGVWTWSFADVSRLNFVVRGRDYSLRHEISHLLKHMDARREKILSSTQKNVQDKVFSKIHSSSLYSSHFPDSRVGISTISGKSRLRERHMSAPVTTAKDADGSLMKAAPFLLCMNSSQRDFNQQRHDLVIGWPRSQAVV